MIFRTKKLIIIAILLMAVIISSLLAGSKYFIYHKEGCWPEYGEYVTSGGMLSTLALIFIMAFFISTYRKWIEKSKSTRNNLIGYSGGLVVASLIVLPIIFIINGAIWYNTLHVPVIVKC
jgi:hypothetical protein